jgi:hypothetical protein
LVVCACGIWHVRWWGGCGCSRSRIALGRPGVVMASTCLCPRPAAILGYRPAGKARCGSAVGGRFRAPT